ncbi:uncharacterized protein [Phyllobates terribilis]|uniref:uncharacterized protein n=1 Tax=Phyllobates terribilis TaxID=111132 RepID=UPI003CCB469C
MVREDVEKAELFNSYFASVFSQKENVTSTDLHYPFKGIEESKLSVNRKIVREYLANINEFKSPGPDELHPRVLKEIVEEILEPLSIIFENSWRTGEVPEDWRRANVVPIFKKGKKVDPGNYRPTLTPRMSSTSSALLLFELLLCLFNPYLSTGQKWESFRKKQITTSAVINCAPVMAGECPESQNFIYTHPRILENVCQYITGEKNVSKSKEFSVSTCKKMPNTSCSYGKADVQIGVICLTCRNRKPVRFVKMGNC